MPEWNEEAHPRADDGKFGSGGSAGDARRTALQRANASALVELEGIIRNAPTMARLQAVGLKQWKPVGVSTSLRKGKPVFTEAARRDKTGDGLSNQARGSIGEEVIARQLYAEGAKWVITRKDAANFSVDMIALHKDGTLLLIEAKTGKVNAVETRWKRGGKSAPAMPKARRR